MGNNSTSPGHGYRIISIEPNSFGSNLNLEIFLDYIIEIKADSKTNALKLLESDEPIELTIFNIFSQDTRKIYISEPRSTIKLGLYIRYESVNPIILHITNVLTGSPAEQSGLKSNIDYLLGIKSHRYNSLDEFSDIVTGQAYSKQQIELCIFSPINKSSPKMITLEPKFNWGGPGALGCEFASGALHQFNFTSHLKIKDDETQITQEQKQEINETQKLTFNIVKQDIELNKSHSFEHQEVENLEINSKDGSLTLSQISDSKKNLKQLPISENLKQNQVTSPKNQIDMKVSQPLEENNSILAELENDNNEQKIKQEEITEVQQIIEDNKNQEEVQEDEDGEITKFKGVLRFQKEGQEQYLEKEEPKQNEHLNSSFQSKNASSDYSHIEQNKIETQPNLLVTQEDNEPKPVVVKYANQLIFKSPKREQMYVVDKKLLFDIQYEVPNYYVNIY